MINKYLVADVRPVANPDNVFTIRGARFTVLSPILIRVEVSPENKFSDEATQIVWFRDTPACKFEYHDDLGSVEIETEAATFYYFKGDKRITRVTIGRKTYPCDNLDNLSGTARTLDNSFGKVRLEKGIIGKDGVAYFVDNSLFLGNDGKLKPRDKNRTDTYVFASQNRLATLQAYFDITGYPPMVPRYALGNWWSRYHAYTQDEYMDLMKKFKEKNIPFSVATVDMDWHWVDIKKQFGWKEFFTRGWTGYSWDKNLFPDYKKFLSDLKEMGLHTSLNLHPALGVRHYEDMYKEMCEAVGQDATKGKPVKFNLTDDKFLNAYFEVLHHPYEKDGVDVWWIDWQQGKRSGLAGLDPLWALNHYHYLASGRDGSRPLILSRYAGLGSHRYPLGFSGDTVINWKVLKFQPYFTATAANCGYFDWSHDIGGHMFGDQKDNELFLRWVQLGVFSPILRLHSTKVGVSKEPWNFPKVEDKVCDALRFRMKLVPYIYDAHFKAFSEGKPICEPLYYRHSADIAYNMPNEYYFGESLLVLPVTDKVNPADGMVTMDFYFPEDIGYTDIFTGEKVVGGGMKKIARTLNSIPVFAKDGTVLPLATDVNGTTANPKELELQVFSGTGVYNMFEDDGESNNYAGGKYAITKFRVSKSDNVVALIKDGIIGDGSVIPENRTYKIKFVNEKGYKITASINNTLLEVEPDENGYITVTESSPTDVIAVVAEGKPTKAEPAESEEATAQNEGETTEEIKQTENEESAISNGETSEEPTCEVSDEPSEDAACEATDGVTEDTSCAVAASEDDK